MANIPESYTVGYQKLGVVVRINYYALYELDSGAREWHYFGCTAEDYPPRTGDPVFEHTYIQLPDDMHSLEGSEFDDLVYQLGRRLGAVREGIA